MLSANITLPGHTLAQCEAPATRVAQRMVLDSFDGTKSSSVGQQFASSIP